MHIAQSNFQSFITLVLVPQLFANGMAHRVHLLLWRHARRILFIISSLNITNQIRHADHVPFIKITLRDT